MHNKKPFTSPRVLQTVEVVLEENLLTGSGNVEAANVSSMGQERKEESFSASDNLWYD